MLKVVYGPSGIPASYLEVLDEHSAAQLGEWWDSDARKAAVARATSKENRIGEMRLCFNEDHTSSGDLLQSLVLAMKTDDTVAVRCDVPTAVDNAKVKMKKALLKVQQKMQAAHKVRHKAKPHTHSSAVTVDDEAYWDIPGQYPPAPAT